MATTTEEIGRGWIRPGWIVFASVLLIVTGAGNVVEGLVALGRRGRVVVVEDRAGGLGGDPDESPRPPRKQCGVDLCSTGSDD